MGPNINKGPSGDKIDIDFEAKKDLKPPPTSAWCFLGGYGV